MTSRSSIDPKHGYARSGGVHIASQVLGVGPPDMVHVLPFGTPVEVGWELQDAEDDGWDGLVGLYRALWQAAGQPDRRYRTESMRDLRLECTEAATAKS